MSARELADAIGGVPTQSTIENIELGRKSTVDVAHLLNIAMAVKVPLSYLLAPLGDPNGGLDLPGLSAEFAAMTTSEFEAWLSSSADGGRIQASLEERNAVSELQALRDWREKSSEMSRLETMLQLENSSLSGRPNSYLRSTEERLDDTRREVERLAAFLRSAGWPNF